MEPFRPPAGPGPIRAVFGPPRKRTSRRSERRTGTRVQRDDPSSKVHEDKHDDELDDDDDDAANDFKISSKDPRCPQIKVGVPKPTSGHQELHHEASSQDIAPSRIWELENKIPKATSGNQERVRDPRARRERAKHEIRTCDDAHAAQCTQKPCKIRGFLGAPFEHIICTKPLSYFSFLCKLCSALDFPNGPLDTKNFKVSRRDSRCPEVGLGIRKRTSGHLKVEILNGPLDTSNSKS